MYEKWVNRIADFFIKGVEKNGNGENVQGKADTIRYFVRSCFYNVPKTILLIILIGVLNIWQYTLVFMFGYCLVRIFSFGVHAKSKIVCTLWGLAYYVGVPLLVLQIYGSISFQIKLAVFAVGFIILILYAPAGTTSKPVRKRNILFNKLLSLMAAINVLLVSYILDMKGYPIQSALMVFGITAQAINLLPFIYKITKERKEYL